MQKVVAIQPPSKTYDIAALTCKSVQQPIYETL